MKDFALKLECCSEEDEQSVKSLALAMGYKQVNGERMDNESYLKFYKSPMTCQYLTHPWVDTTYQMPRDWDDIQEALGVEIAPKYVEITEIKMHTWQDTFKIGHIFKLQTVLNADPEYWYVGNGRVINRSCANIVSKEAFDTQETKKKASKIAGEIIKNAANKYIKTSTKETLDIREAEKEIKQIADRCGVTDKEFDSVISEIHKITLERSKSISVPENGREIIIPKDGNKITMTDIVKKYGYRNATDIMTKSKRIAELENKVSITENQTKMVLSANQSLINVNEELEAKNKALSELNANQVEQIKSLDSNITEYKMILDNIASNFA